APLPLAITGSAPSSVSTSRAPLPPRVAAIPEPETASVAARHESAAPVPAPLHATMPPPLPAAVSATLPPVADAAAVADAPPSDEHPLESAEPVPDEAIALATPDKSGERPVHHAPSPPPPPPQPASTVRAIDPSLPPLASAVRPIESWRPLARQRARGLRVGIAAVLVGAGFILGRVTAPTPSVTF